MDEAKTVEEWLKGNDTYAIAEVLLEKSQPIHDLLQKAVGWLPREAWKRDMDRLRKWLNLNMHRMPRTMLRSRDYKCSCSSQQNR